MPFPLHPALAAILGNNQPPSLRVHDIHCCRKQLDTEFPGLLDNQPRIVDVETKDFTTITEDGHQFALRWFTKIGYPLPGSAILYSHGGGMVALSLHHCDQIIKRYVSRTSVPFLAVEYRLAPEFKAPTQVLDVYTGPRRIWIMGDSAGGGITASLAHYIKLKGGPPVAKQVLIYPMLDDRNYISQPATTPFLTWTPDDNMTGWSALLGTDRIASPTISILKAAGRMTSKEASSLPPAYINVGELDLFRDENIKYARNLGKGGVSGEMHLVVPGVPHAFESYAPEADVSRFIMEQREKAIKSI